MITGNIVPSLRAVFDGVNGARPGRQVLPRGEPRVSCAMTSASLAQRDAQAGLFVNQAKHEGDENQPDGSILKSRQRPLDSIDRFVNHQQRYDSCSHAEQAHGRCGNRLDD